MNNVIPQDGWLSNDPFREILLRMTRKPRPHQFIGLMGKRSMGENSFFFHLTVSCFCFLSFCGLVFKLFFPSSLAQQMHRSPGKVSTENVSHPFSRYFIFSKSQLMSQYDNLLGEFHHLQETFVLISSHLISDHFSLIFHLLPDFKKKKVGFNISKLGWRNHHVQGRSWILHVLRSCVPPKPPSPPDKEKLSKCFIWISFHFLSVL